MLLWTQGGGGWTYLLGNGKYSAFSSLIESWEKPEAHVNPYQEEAKHEEDSWKRHSDRSCLQSPC